MNGQDILLTLSKKYGGDWETIMNAIKKKEHITEDNCDSFDSSKEIAIIDKDYPACFKEIHQPPFIVYFNGSKESICSILKTRIGFVSDETDSKYTIKMAKRFGEAIAIMGATLVCRNTTTPERECVESAIMSGGDVIIPEQSITSNTTPHITYVSECPEGAEGRPQNVCKALAALSDCVIVGEILKNHSGTQTTLTFALGANKNVGIIPFEADYDNENNLLIKEGAILVENAQDIKDMISH